MLLRFWAVLSMLWVLVVLLSASKFGVRGVDLVIAFVVPAIALVLGRAGRWIVRGC